MRLVGLLQEVLLAVLRFSLGLKHYTEDWNLGLSFGKAERVELLPCPDMPRCHRGVA